MTLARVRRCDFSGGRMVLWVCQTTTTTPPPCIRRVDPRAEATGRPMVGEVVLHSEEQCCWLWLLLLVVAKYGGVRDLRLGRKWIDREAGRKSRPTIPATRAIRRRLGHVRRP